MLNVQRLRILREVASRGTLAAAAEAMWLTPPAVSQQLATLEREIGLPLLERDGRRVRLTSAGELLVGHAERILADMEEASAELAQLKGELSGDLRVSAFPTAARSLLIPALLSLRERHPHLRLFTNDLEPEESVPALKAGHLDVVALYDFDAVPGVDDPGIEREELLVEPIYLVLPVGHRLAGKSVSVADLRDELFIVGRDTTSLLDFTVRVALEAGFTPLTDLHSNDFDVILSMVAAGLGVALVPALAFTAQQHDIVLQPLVDRDLKRRVYCAIRRGSHGNPAIAAVVDALREAASTLACEIAPPSGRKVRKLNRDG